MASATGAVPLLIRARLSTHDDTDSDISPVYSHSDDGGGGDSYGSAASDSDPDTGGFGDDAVTLVASSTTRGLDSASSVGFGRGIAVPVAKISGDEEEDDGGSEEDGDWGFSGGVARVLSTERELNSVDYDDDDDDDDDDYGLDYGYLGGTYIAGNGFWYLIFYYSME